MNRVRRVTIGPADQLGDDVGVPQSVVANMSISLDGFVAGPNQSLENPIGEGGLRLHEWMFRTAAWARREGGPEPPTTPDSEVVDTMHANVGAFIMGRHMFSPGRGEWDTSWRGWWGDDPPYHHPVFVLTHHRREPLPMAGGTTFHFVTEGIVSALGRAREAAGDMDVLVTGGAETVRQYLRAGLLNRMTLHLAPVLLGGGERLLDGVGDLELAALAVVASPAVTHITYAIRTR
jgi:dihydrofolate reductase